MISFRFLLIVVAILPASAFASRPPARPGNPDLPRLAHHQPGLLVDLGVGLWAWPLPLDYNDDGHMDLMVVCTGRPSTGTWYFENSTQIDSQTKLPIFHPAVYVAKAVPSATISYVTGTPVVTSTGHVYPDFKRSLFDQPHPIPGPEKIHPEPGFIRQNQWQLVDYDGDGALDLSVGLDFWGDHGPAYGGKGPFEGKSYDAQGNWRRGPLHGYVYLLRNSGSSAVPIYSAPAKVMAAGQAVDPYGMPSPCWGDFDSDGDLDLICGSFHDNFTYYENVGTRITPRYAAGRLLTLGAVPLTMELCMITPTSVDFDGDGDLDLVVGDEDGRVALVENTSRLLDGLPQFLPPRYFRQFADYVKFGAIPTPYAFDWDGDGDEDLITGNTAGHVGFIENLGGDPLRWAAPRYLSAGGKLIREQAGPNGSIHGPSEPKWGYSNVCVADWDKDGLPDLVTNGIWGKVVWYRNIGTRAKPRLDVARPIEVAPGTNSPKPEWNWWNPQGREFVTQWRTTPQVIDWNGDGLPDLVMMDHEGYLALFERRRAADGTLTLTSGQRVFHIIDGPSSFDASGRPLNQEPGVFRFNGRPSGPSGRRAFTVVDWDGDGILDLMVNSINATYLRGNGRDAAGNWTFQNLGPLSKEILAGHGTKPAAMDWNQDGVPDLLVGAEDGFFYLLPNPRTK